MNCQDIKKQFDGALDSQLGEGARREFETHLVACGDCRREWRALSRVWAVLEKAPTVEPRFGFADRTLRRLEEEPQRPAVLEWLLDFGVKRWALTAATCTVLLGASAMVLWQQAQKAKAAEVYATVKNTDLLEDFDVIAALDLLEGEAQP